MGKSELSEPEKGGKDSYLYGKQSVLLTVNVEDGAVNFVDRSDHTC